MATKVDIKDIQGKVDFSQSTEPTLNTEQTNTAFGFFDYVIRAINWLKTKLGDKADENQAIDFDTITEPNETGTKTKTSTTLWQNLFAHINFLWLKLKVLFPTTQATTHNYLPKVDNADKKLVKSNINDDGVTPKYGTNTIWHSGNDGTNSGLDADTLDTKHASDFATSTHTHDYSASNHNHDTTYAKLSFANIKVGAVDVAASRDSSVELIAGTNVTLTADDTEKTITIAATGGGGGIQTVTLASGTNNGTLKLTVDDNTVDNIPVKGLDLDSVLGSVLDAEDCLTVLDASDSYKMKRGPAFRRIGYSPDWYLSAEGTWKTLKYRAIHVNGTGHLGIVSDNALNFVDGANTAMSVTSNLGVTSIQVNCNPASYLASDRLLLSGKVSINPGRVSGSYTEGLRIGNSSSGYSLIALGTDGTDGTSDNGINTDGKQWHIMKRPTGELVLTYDNSVNSGLTLEKNGSMKWRGTPLLVGSRIVSGVTSMTMEFDPGTKNEFDIVLGQNEKYIMPVHEPSMLASKDIVINLSTLGSEQDFSESEVTLEIPFVMHENGDINVIFESGSLNIFYSENFKLISELEGEGNMLYRIRYIEQMNRWSISSELFIM